uniref:Cytochrome c-553 n=1 Tax=Cyclophora tenuis TaxID=216820 RepID=A0A7S1GGH4_CYCTE|mmetsp:Transcript_12140/g.20556  ORF Transcript_12140/g.20556 Transcript_12140/m.20556 type:complete len:137 (+) Transcript_12140:78-488(+)
MKLAILATLAVSASAFSFITEKELTKVAQGAAVAGAITFGVVAPAFAGDVAAGETVFNANCAACHAGGQNVIMPEKTLEKEALESFLAGGRNEAAVMKQVEGGKNAMPAFGGRLSDEEIADVAAYVIATSEAGWDE